MILNSDQRDYIFDAQRWWEHLVNDINNKDEVIVEDMKREIDEVITNLYRFKQSLGGTK